MMSRNGSRSPEHRSTPQRQASKRVPQPFFTTKRGRLLIGDSRTLLGGPLGQSLAGKVQLLFTSPPFPLNHKKSYGNKTGDEYIAWLSELAPIWSDLLAP